jgi:nucleoside-diphosphate-sugar epimerase
MLRRSVNGSSQRSSKQDLASKLALYVSADRIAPDGLYGVWKAFGETLGRYYSDTFGLQVTCVRIGSITAIDRPDDPSLRFERRSG